MGPRLKRLATMAGASLTLPLIASLLVGCGSGNGQIAVSLSPSSDRAFKAGETPQFIVVVTNNGPGDAPGIVVHVDMPGSFRYKTSSITGSGIARVQPVDARVGASDPSWGVWNLSAPTLQSGQLKPSHLDISLTVDVEATPNTYAMVARASGENTGGELLSKPYAAKVQASPRLSVSASVATSMLKPRDHTTYSITINNTGTDVAGNVGVLITLPPILTFQQSVLPFRGNASRSNPVDPVKGSVLVFYSGFFLPAASSMGPGFVALVFAVEVAPHPATGSFPLNVQVTDDIGDVVTLSNAASVSVQGAGSVTPNPVSTPTETASPTP